MAGVRDRELIRLRGFPAGVNNVAPNSALPVDPETGAQIALRAGVNVDLVGPRKSPRLREGYLQSLAGRAHSPAVLHNTLFVVVDGDMLAIDQNMQATTHRVGVGHLYASYAEVNGDLYWSTPTEMRRIRGYDLADTPLWPANPGAPAVEPYGTGGMAAGAYRVAMTWFDAEGRESGASGVAVADIAEGQGVRVFNIPTPPEGAAKARIYISPPDGEELYAALDILPAVTQTVLGAGAGQDGKAIETLWRQPLPPCSILRFWNGRLLGASGNLLVWSDALRFGLTTHDNYMRFGQRITMLEPLADGEGNAGVFIADHARVYWMAGTNPKDWRRVIRYDASVVPGTSLIVDAGDVGLSGTGRVAFWLSTNGVFCAGLPGGEVRPLTDGRLALPDGEQGASLYREHNGLRQLVTSYLTSNGNGLAMRDRASATVTRISTP